MSEPTSKYDRFGFDKDPFATGIADEEIASRYELVGREEQEHQLEEFVEEGIRSPAPMNRRLIFGEYGTGKSHHLIRLRDQIESGVVVNDTEYDAIAVYVANLGLSIKRLYEKIIEEIKRFTPELEDLVDSLDDVEPERSVDEAYQFERLQDNITENLRRVANAAREDFGYRALFIFIDEAEDIANGDEETVQPFIRAFLHLVNDLNAAGIHILLGFSQGARIRITSYEDDEDTLGNALVQRFQGGEIYLGDLTTDDVEEMLIDRMDQHRTSNVGEISPIVEKTVDVVTQVTGGHPRETLAVYSEALDYAQELEKDRIDGEAVLHALTGFGSFTRDEQLLGPEELTNLHQALDEANSEARNDFERLEGRLIGETEAVPEDAFSEGVPGTLLNPITIKGEQELRILEQRDEHGRYYYVISEEAKDYLFGTGGEGGTQIQKLDLQASSAPKKYQKEMSRGLGIALQDNGHGSLHKSPVTQRRDRHEFGLYLIEINREAGKKNQNVAIGVYNGQEIPEELVRLYVEAIEDDRVAFGVLVKENQQLSAEANRYLTELNDISKSYFEDRVIEINLTTEDRDEFIYGRLLALGDPDSDADEEVDTSYLVNELEFIPVLKDTFDEVILPFPEERYRNVVNHLRGESTRTFTIGDLKDALDLEQYALNGDIMDGLRVQSLVAKDGQRWTYPNLEADKPPWYELYRHLNEAGPLTLPELQKRIAREYVFDCPPGDENRMFQWYLDHLQMQDYVEPTEVTCDGETVDAYQVVSVTEQFNQARRTADERLNEVDRLVEDAVDLDVDGLNSFQNRSEDLKARLKNFEEIFDPEHSDLAEVNALIEDITELEENLEDSISDRERAILAEADDVVKIEIGDLRDRIDDEGGEGSFEQRLDEIDGKLHQFQEELKDLIDAEEYVRLNTRTNVIQEEVRDLEAEVGEILQAKGRAAEEFENVKKTKQDAEEAVAEISSQNPISDELKEDLEELEDLLNDYRNHYNNDEYERALEVLTKEAWPLAEEIEKLATNKAKDQEQYQARLDDLEREVERIDDSDHRQEGQEIIESARRNLRSGNFADLPTEFKNVQELIEGPTREEEFETALRKYEGSLAETIEHEDFDVSEAFRFLRRFYTDSDYSTIEDVKAVIGDE